MACWVHVGGTMTALFDSVTYLLIIPFIAAQSRDLVSLGIFMLEVLVRLSSLLS